MSARQWPSEASPISLSIPSTVHKARGSSKTVSVEASGMIPFADGLYVVSDSGSLLYAPRGTTSPTWMSQYVRAKGKENDFECLTCADHALMLGVEGFDPDGDHTKPRILRFAPSDAPGDFSLGAFTGEEWKLDDYQVESAHHGSGMEALSFVPDGSYPGSWLLGSPYNTRRSTGYRTAYGGIFLVATQTELGTIRVYDLPRGGPSVTPVNHMGAFTGLNTRLPISDLYFDAASGNLFVLYDGAGDENDALEIHTINHSSSHSSPLGRGGELSRQCRYELPYRGAEGICVDGADLYLCIDVSRDQSQGELGDGVYLFPGLVDVLLAAG